MNFAGHIELARLLGHHQAPTGHGRDPDPQPDLGFLLGAALPDLASIGRFRLVARPTDPEVAAGVELHHRTDVAFHRHRWFRFNSAALTARLIELGLARGAARACGHVGLELLLDGRLLAERADLRPSVQGAMGAAGRGSDGLGGLVAPERRPAWTEHLHRVARWEVPGDYHRPEAVAARLQRILARRPRLSFPADRVPIVAAALAERQEAVRAGVDPLVAELVVDLAREPATPS